MSQARKTDKYSQHISTSSHGIVHVQQHDATGCHGMVCQNALLPHHRAYGLATLPLARNISKVTPAVSAYRHANEASAPARDRLDTISLDPGPLDRASRRQSPYRPNLLRRRLGIRGGSGHVRVDKRSASNYGLRPGDGSYRSHVTIIRCQQQRYPRQSARTGYHHSLLVSVPCSRGVQAVEHGQRCIVLQDRPSLLRQVSGTLRSVQRPHGQRRTAQAKIAKGSHVPQTPRRLHGRDLPEFHRLLHGCHQHHLFDDGPVMRVLGHLFPAHCTALHGQPKHFMLSRTPEPRTANPHLSAVTPHVTVKFCRQSHRPRHP